MEHTPGPGRADRGHADHRPGIWITTELAKGLAAERTLAAEAKARAESPPDPTLAVVYGELAAAEGRHHLILETGRWVGSGAR